MDSPPRILRHDCEPRGLLALLLSLPHPPARDGTAWRQKGKNTILSLPGRGRYRVSGAIV